MRSERSRSGKCLGIASEGELVSKCRKVSNNSLCLVGEVLIPSLLLHFPDRTFTADLRPSYRK